VIGFAGQDSGAAGAANTLLTPGGDGGNNIVNGLQNRAVSGHVDDVSAPQQLDLECRAAGDGTGETLTVQAEVASDKDPGSSSKSWRDDHLFP
jgi:hypothetical protein